jgi:curved DNA-binding protein CbpA
MTSNVLDPFKELGLDYTANIYETREQFKKLARIHHPDKGGDRIKFERLKSAYTYLYKYFKNQQKQLNRESMTYNKYQQDRISGIQDVKQKINEKEIKKIFNPKTKRFDNKKFNRLYEHVKIKDEDDEGYGDGSEFDPDKNKNLQIQRIDIPDGVDTLSNQKIIGSGRSQDFSQRNIKSKSNFTDYNRAFRNEDARTMPNVRKEHKSLNSLKNERSKISYKMNEKDRKIYDRKRMEEEKTEQLRRYKADLVKQQQEKSMLRLQNYLRY